MPESPAAVREVVLEALRVHAGFDGHQAGLLVEGADAVQPLEIDGDRPGDGGRSPAHARACTERDQRDPVLVCPPDHRDQLLTVRRGDHGVGARKVLAGTSPHEQP